MAVIVEDGSIVPDANSFVSSDDFTSYAQLRSISLVDVDTDAALIKAADYINSLSSKIKGAKVDRDQPMAFPRNDFECEGWYWSNNEIPRQVIYAQMALAIAISHGEDPYNPSPVELPVIKERVEGAIEVQYANPKIPSKVYVDGDYQRLINLLLKNSGLMLVR